MRPTITMSGTWMATLVIMSDFAKAPAGVQAEAYYRPARVGNRQVSGLLQALHGAGARPAHGDGYHCDNGGHDGRYQRNDAHGAGRTRRADCAARTRRPNGSGCALGPLGPVGPAGPAGPVVPSIPSAPAGPVELPQS